MSRPDLAREVSGGGSSGQHHSGVGPEVNPIVDENKLRRILLHIIGLLVRGEYEALVSFTGGRRLTMQMMQDIVAEWPYSLTMPLHNEIEDLVGASGEISGSNPHQWWVDVNLYTIEEGRSDLMLQLTVTDDPGEFYRVEMNDLHVL